MSPSTWDSLLWDEIYPNRCVQMGPISAFDKNCFSASGDGGGSREDELIAFFSD